MPSGCCGGSGTGLSHRLPIMNERLGAAARPRRIVEPSVGSAEQGPHLPDQVLTSAEAEALITACSTASDRDPQPGAHHGHVPAGATDRPGLSRCGPPTSTGPQHDPASDHVPAGRNAGDQRKCAVFSDRSMSAALRRLASAGHVVPRGRHARQQPGHPVSGGRHRPRHQPVCNSRPPWTAAARFPPVSQSCRPHSGLRSSAAAGGGPRFGRLGP